MLAPTLLGAVSPDWIEANKETLGELFLALNPNDASVAPALRAWTSDHRSEACALLVEATRAHPARLPGLEPTLLLPHDIQYRAEQFLEGRYDPLGDRVLLTRRSDGGIDWRQRGPTGDKEFAWMLNRHLFLTDLLLAARKNPDPRYFAMVDRLLSDWVISNPYPDRLTFSAPWRALEVARRLLDCWGPFYDNLRADGVLSDESLLLFLSAIPHHADALLEHASSWGGNHLITEKTALVLAGHQWPEFRDAARWCQDGISSATREILSQTYPDGAYMELSNHYHRVVLQAAQQLVDLLVLANEPVPHEFQSRLDAMWNYFAKVMKPDGSGPLNNAGDFEFNRGLIEARGGIIAMAEETDLIFRWAGQAVLRDDWKATGNWAFFDYGPQGTAHQHDDALQTSVVLGGKDFLVDAGRFTYHPGPWKDYFTGPQSHNVLTLDGFQRRPRPRQSEAAEGFFLLQTDDVTAIKGEQWFDAERPPLGRTWRQERLVIRIRNQGFVIVDRLTGFNPTKATFRWHFSPHLERPEIENQFLSGTPAATIWRRGSIDPVAGWHSSQYGEKQEAWQREDTYYMEGPQNFVWTMGSGIVFWGEHDPNHLIVLTAERTLQINLNPFSVTVEPRETDTGEVSP